MKRWSELPYWEKGFHVGGVLFILFFFYTFVVTLSEPANLPQFSFVTSVPESLSAALISLINPPSYAITALWEYNFTLTLLFILLEFVILGAVIGWIVGSCKKEPVRSHRPLVRPVRKSPKAKRRKRAR